MSSPQNKELDIFVGSKIGSFKHIKYYTDISKNSKKCIDNLIPIKSLKKDDSIKLMAWTNAEQTEILIGKQNYQVQLYDTIHGFKETYKKHYSTGQLVGLGRFGQELVTAYSSGDFKFWDEEGKSRTDVSLGREMERMKIYRDEHFAFGGEESDLQVWVISESRVEPIFEAKNIPHDWLQLQQPVWVTDLCYLNGTTLAACSRYGYVRLYDTRAQRRPVCNIETSMAATCISHAQDERQVLVGFARGQLHLADLRMGRLDKGYKGATGAITGVERAGQLLVSAGLDRQLRVHCFHTKELLYKQYMTSKISCLLVQTESRTKLRHPPESVEDDGDVKEEEDVAEDMDDIFQGMETVGDNSRKHKGDPVGQEAKKKKISEIALPVEDGEDGIKQLLKKTEKQKRRIEKKKKEKKAKSVYHTA